MISHYSHRQLWTNEHNDGYYDEEEEVVFGSKPPGLCYRDVYMRLSDSAQQLIIGTLTELSFLIWVRTVVSHLLTSSMRWDLCQTSCFLSSQTDSRLLHVDPASVRPP